MEFFNQSLRDICLSSLASSYKNNSFYMESIRGRLKFKFPFIISNNINLHVKKISGNGKFVCNNKEYLCHSKECQIISIPFQQEIEIVRNNDSLGEIAIVGFSLDAVPEKEDECVSSKWKAIISRCGNYSGIKLIGNKLFAIEGAKFLDVNLIESLETIPPNAFSKNNEEIKFNIGAEIVDLKISSSLKDIPSTVVQPFVHRNDAMIEIKPPISSYTLFNTSNMLNKPNKTSYQKAEEINYNQFVIYDSKNTLSKIFLSGNKLAKHIQSNGQNFISMKKNGVFSMPLSSLRAGGNYIIIVSAQRLSGNGRLYVGFSSDSETKYSALTIESIFHDKNIQLSLPPSFNSPHVNITMLDDSSGEILIKKIMVIEDVPTVNRFALIKKLSSNNSNYKNSFAVFPQTSIKESTKDSSRFYVEPASTVLECPCIIESCTFSSSQWLAKVAPFISGLKVRDDKKLFHNVDKSKDNPTFLMTKLGKLNKSCPNVYLDSWDPKYSISEHDLQVLKKCKRIVVSSFANFIDLKLAINDSNIVIECLSKPWIFNNSNIPPFEKYFIYFEKNELITRSLMDFWTGSMIPLCVVGTTLDSPVYIKKISEFLPWSKLSSLFLGASAVLDFDFNYGESSIFDSAKMMNKKIITNNTNLDNNMLYVPCDIENNYAILNTDLLSELTFDHDFFSSDKIKLPNKQCSSDFNAFVKGSS